MKSSRRGKLVESTVGILVMSSQVAKHTTEIFIKISVSECIAEPSGETNSVVCMLSGAKQTSIPVCGQIKGKTRAIIKL